jgi:hypothetical protein
MTRFWVGAMLKFDCHLIGDCVQGVSCTSYRAVGELFVEPRGPKGFKQVVAAITRRTL